MFDMSNDSHLFRTREQLEAEGWTLEGNVFHRNGQQMLPLYQGIMSSPFDHRAADVIRSETALKRQNQPGYLSIAEKQDPFRVARPMYWLPGEEVLERLGSWREPWLLTFRDVTSPTNERTLVSTVTPRAAVGHKTPLVLSEHNNLALHALLSSFVVDYLSRQKVGGTSMTYFFVRQFPVVSPDGLAQIPDWATCSFEVFVTQRSLELHYTSHEMSGLARAFHSFDGPFKWDAERRKSLRAEIDAAAFRLYGLQRNHVEYIMETFPIVKRKDIAEYGEYRTKRLVLEVYDAMQHAIDTGTEYQTILDPPPGHGPRHPAKEH